MNSLWLASHLRTVTYSVKVQSQISRYTISRSWDITDYIFGAPGINNTITQFFLKVKHEYTHNIPVAPITLYQYVQTRRYWLVHKIIRMCTFGCRGRRAIKHVFRLNMVRPLDVTKLSTQVNCKRCNITSAASPPHHFHHPNPRHTHIHPSWRPGP